MKHSLLKSIIAISSIAIIFACSDDSSSPESENIINNNNNDICSKIIAFSDVSVFENNGSIFVIYLNENTSIVTNAAGETIGYYIPFSITDLASNPIIEGLDPILFTTCKANASKNPNTGEIEISSSSIIPTSSNIIDPNLSENNPISSAVIEPNSSAVIPPTSSSNVNPDSGSIIPGTSETIPLSSSSEIEPVSSSVELDKNGFPTLESYGAPPAEYTKDISNSGKRGWNTRYWDACKPHCSWISNGEEGKTDTTTEESYQKGMTTARNCNIHDVEVPTFTLGSAVTKYWMGYEGTNSACGNAKDKGVFTCTDMAPIAVNENLSYGYVAGTADGKCGKCYHLQYDGHFKDEMETNKPKATHQALKGKHMIVMASNIGHDVGGATGNFKCRAI